MCSFRGFRSSGFDVRKGITLALRLMLLAVVTSTVCYAQEERKPTQNPPPVYPSLARQLRLSGVVKIKAVVTPDGQVKQVEVVGGHPLLAQAAVDAVKSWKYDPTKTETHIEMEFRFQP
jgi:TonB family protein